MSSASHDNHRVQSVRRLYLSNLPYKATETDVCDFFEAEGFFVREVFILKARGGAQDGKPSGCCFVELDEPNLSQAAIDTLNESQLQGRKIGVKFAHAKK